MLAMIPPVGSLAGRSAAFGRRLHFVGRRTESPPGPRRGRQMGTTVDRYMLYELTLDAPEYPAGVRHALGARAPERIAALGDVALLGGRMLALVGSVRAPGSIILGAYD